MKQSPIARNTLLERIFAHLGSLLRAKNALAMTHHQIRNSQYLIRNECCVFLFILLTACLPQAAPTPFIPPTRVEAVPTAATNIVFASPTAVEIAMPTATVTPRPSPTPEEPTATPLPPCSASLRYLGDITYPDGTLVSPGQRIQKQWLVENNGSCDWERGHRLKLVGGFPLGVFGEVALYPARAGTQAVIEIDFTAPLEAGLYRTAWQAFNPDGAPFGDAVYMEIVVQ
jgi:hypothetical protein